MDFKTDIQPILLGQARHLATVAGTALVGAGYLSTGKLAVFEDSAVGIAVILGSMGFSAVQKYLAANKTALQVQAAAATIPQPILDQLEAIASAIAASPKVAPILQPSMVVPAAAQLAAAQNAAINLAPPAPSGNV